MAIQWDDYPCHPKWFDDCQMIESHHRVNGFPDQDHLFIVIDGKDLKSELVSLIQDKQLQIKKGSEGREWVKKYHDPIKAVQKIREWAYLISG